MTWFTDEDVEKGLNAFCNQLKGDGDTLEAALRAALSAVNPYQWKPIETAPKDGTAILRWCPTKDGEATHWLPVPPAPEGDR